MHPLSLHVCCSSQFQVPTSHSNNLTYTSNNLSHIQVFPQALNTFFLTNMYLITRMDYHPFQLFSVTVQQLFFFFFSPFFMVPCFILIFWTGQRVIMSCKLYVCIDFFMYSTLSLLLFYFHAFTPLDSQQFALGTFNRIF